MLIDWPGPPALRTFTSVGFIVCMALVCDAPLLTGHQSSDPISPRGAVQRPAIRVETQIVELDVFVADAKGNFARDLTRDDFEIIEDGRAQQIQDVRLIDTSTLVSRTASTGPDDQEAAERNRSRVFALVLDSASSQLCPAARGDTYPLSVRQVATQFVDGFVRASDEVAVVNVQGPRTASQELTTRKELVRAAIGRYGQGLSGDTSVVTDETSGSVRLQRHLMTLQSLRETTERLGTITGRRKAILWVGGQIVYEMPECPFGRDTSTLACQLQLNWGQVLAAHRELIGAATRSNVTVHAIDPCGLTPAIGRVELDRQAALRHIAQDTGGVAIVNTNKFADGFAAVDRDSSLYYIVSYAPAITYHDGKFHEVKVRVRRKGLSARSRKGYVALPSPH